MDSSELRFLAAYRQLSPTEQKVLRNYLRSLFFFLVIRNSSQRLKRFSKQTTT